MAQSGRTAGRAAAVLAAMLLLAPAARADDPPPPPAPAADGLPDEVRANRDLLRHVEDDRPVAGPDENFEEVWAYNYLLRLARSVPPETLRTYADRTVTFAHLFGELRDEYRGALVRLEGRLRRVRKLNAPKMLQDEGVKDLYESWVFTSKDHAYPVCVLTTELPAGLAPAEELDEFVRFDAYFFKRYQYKASDGWRRAPLLIGRTLELATPPTGETVKSAFRDTFVPLVVAGIVAVGGAALGLSWLYRRGDRAVRERLGDARARNPFGPAPQDP